MKNRIISVVLCIVMIVSCCTGCKGESVDTINVELGNDSTEEINMTVSSISNATQKKEPTNVPSISITVVDGEKTPTEKDNVLIEEANKEESNITSMVYSAVNFDLQEKGYITTENCIAFSSDETYSAIGIVYSMPELQLFTNTDYAAHGFVTVIGAEDEYLPIPTECEYIAVESIEGSFNNNALYNLLAYTCESIGYGHFIYENQYVIYYQLDSTTVKYETYENKSQNYDLGIGSLYDFDNNTYIYDASLFDGYVTHSATELFSKEDYMKLETELQVLSKEQEKNGYYIEELEIVYISPESIQAYLESEEEDTFFGYSVQELEQSVGLGSALVYTENGLELASYYEEGLENYNWKSFLTKVGIGTGIIIVGAIVAPMTSGVSFGCALVTISTITLSASLAEGLGTLAIETAIEMMEGKEFVEALKNASNEGLDAFANTFVITAAITSVGANAGLIKPVACFVEETKISIPDSSTALGIGYKNIEDIVVGDFVFSYNELAERYGINKVTNVYVNKTKTLVHITVDGEKISVTENHPFYNPYEKGWKMACKLEVGDYVLLLNGQVVQIEKIELELFDKECIVYNLEVEGNHTYFVGEHSILVHNECSTIEALRNAGVNSAWKKEVEAVKNGTSKYNWTRPEIEELLARGRISGYDGCHIIDVHVNPALAANSDNIIFLKREVHLRVVHRGNWKNDSHWGEIIKIMPQFAEQIKRMKGLL